MGEAGRTVRDQARVLKLEVEAHSGRQVDPAEPIMLRLIRWAAMSVPMSQAERAKV